MEPTEDFDSFLSTPSSDSPPTRPLAARHKNQPNNDTSSQFSNAGTWIDSDMGACATICTHPTEIQLSPPPNPARAHSQLSRLRCDTHQTLSSILFPEDYTEIEIEPTSPYSPHSDSIRLDDSSLPDQDADGDVTDEDKEDAFYSAPSSPTCDDPNTSSQIRLDSHDIFLNPNPLRSIESICTSPVGEDDTTSNFRLRLGIPNSSPFLSPLASPPAVSPIALSAISPEPSVISDAGLQQQLKQEQRRTWIRAPSSSRSSLVDKHCTSFVSGSENWPLQKKIFDETKRTATALNPFAPAFLPEGQLQIIMNRQSIYEELERRLHSGYDNQDLSRTADLISSTKTLNIDGKKIFNSFRKIFAILVLSDSVPSIMDCIDTNVSDIDLPLLPVLQGQTIVGLRKQNSEESLKCFTGENWSYFKLESFEKYQWMMLAPFFSHGEDGEVKHYKLRDNHILPFVDYHKAAGSLGGFAKVMMVDIHSDHYNFHSADSTEHHEGGFAIKQLNRDSREDFDRERLILKKFSGPHRHSYVVSLLATYEQHGKFHFIFHRAEGDLFQIWNEVMPNPNVTYVNILWMAKQCAGIADGLLHLHRRVTSIRREEVGISNTIRGPDNITKDLPFRSEIMQSSGTRVPLDNSLTQIHQHENALLTDTGANTNAELKSIERFGRHGDIDPGNILCYIGNKFDLNTLQGSLKLADFGQARINRQESKTTHSAVANKLTYRAPEYDMLPRSINELYDIWCLGCVYLEFVTWMLGGATLCKYFYTVRMTPNIMRNDLISDEFFDFETINSPIARVKPVVTQFIKYLHNHRNCTEFIHEILSLIQYDMLVVSLSDRKPCNLLKKKLDNLRNKCEKSEDYACKRNPWGQ